MSRSPVVVRTDQGLVRGRRDDDVAVFEAIPYAAAPEGELRWRAPQPAAAWDGVLDATRPGAVCPQPAGIRPAVQSEDCLNLKVTVPAARSARPRPVMVFLDAGGLVVSANVGTDHRRLAVQGEVVVVQPNERVGWVGFFAHPDLHEPGAGAFGLQDHQSALRWVQRNIAAFGGDPDNVTLFGISGGGIATCANLTSPDAAGLFHRVIVQSGAAQTDLLPPTPGAPAAAFVRSLEAVRHTGADLAGALGLAGAPDVPARLRALPPAAFAGHESRFAAIAYGNAVLPTAPIDALRAGRFPPVPMMIGVTRDEATFWMNQIVPDGLDEATYRALVDDGTGHVERVLERYPAHRHRGSTVAAMTAAVGDRHMALRVRQTQRAASRHVPVYAYEFADRTAPLDPGYALPPREAVAQPYGAYHGSDFQYLVDTDDHRAPFDREQEDLSRQMIGYWSAFAHHGDPAGGGRPPWHPFEEAGPAPFVLRLTTASQGGIRPADDHAVEHHLDFWDELYPAGHTDP